MRKFLGLLLLVAMMLVTAAPATVTAQDGGDEEELPSIAELVVAATEGEEAEFTILLAAVEAAGLTDALAETGPYTVFAPTDAAFGDLLEALDTDAETLLADTELLTSVLLYHVVPGTFYAEDVAAADGASVATAFWGSSVDISVTEDGAVMVDGATVVAVDVEANNGVVHVIDSVILPDEDEGALREFPAGEDSIVDIASSTEGFATLTAAVLASEAAATYLTEAQFATVFAPNDEAFAELLGLLELEAEDLLADEEALTQVLAYHVIPWAYTAEDVIALDGAYIGTLLPGWAVLVTVEEESVFIDDSEVIATDIEASNGFIHVVDFVLLPIADEGMDDDMGDDEMSEDDDMGDDDEMSDDES